MSNKYTRLLLEKLAISISVSVLIFMPLMIHRDAQALFGDDYPWPNADMSKNSPLKFAYRNCTDYVAWRLNVAMGGNETNIEFDWTTLGFSTGEGDAKDWKQAAEKSYSVDSNPALGAVAWWGTGEYGHVAIVGQVNSSTNIIVEEYNSEIKGGYGTRNLIKGTATWPEYFLHIKDSSDGKDEVGVRSGNRWFLNYDNDSDSEKSFTYGASTDTAIVGDWNGDGKDEVGVRSGNRWFLNYDNDSDSEKSFTYGASTDTAIVGDWNGDGKDEVGVRSGNRWFLNYDNDSDSEKSFTYGASTDTAIVGDWNGDGKDEVGVRSGNRWFLNYDNDSDSEKSFTYGASTDTAIVGDWNGDGKDEVGVRSGNRWFLNYDNDSDSEKSFTYGASTDTAIVGDWNGE